MINSSIRFFKVLAIIGTIIGIAFATMGLSILIFDINFGFPNNDSAPYGFILVGSLTSVITVFSWWQKSHESNQEKIDNADERNQMILYKASYYTLTILMGIGVLSILLLSMLGYLTGVAFITIMGVFIVSFISLLIFMNYFNNTL